MEKQLSIAQTSEKFHIAASALHYYEKIGLMNPVEKNTSGHRIYKEKDFRRINFIKTLREARVTIEQIKTYVDLFHEGEHIIPQRKQLLIEQLHLLQQQFDNLLHVIDDLRDIIQNYEDTLVKREMDQRRKNST